MDINEQVDYVLSELIYGFNLHVVFDAVNLVTELAKTDRRRARDVEWALHSAVIDYITNGGEHSKAVATLAGRTSKLYLGDPSACELFKKSGFFQ